MRQAAPWHIAVGTALRGRPPLRPVCGANHRPAGDPGRYRLRERVGFASGKSHSFRMPGGSNSRVRAAPTVRCGGGFIAFVLYAGRLTLAGKSRPYGAQRRRGCGFKPMQKNILTSLHGLVYYLDRTSKAFEAVRRRGGCDAGAGAYSLYFARRGCGVDALELADRINAMTKSGCAPYLRCHFHSCEKLEMLGRSNHPLFVGKRDSETEARPTLSGRHGRAANAC